ncbi:hypothetical protein EOD39_15593 [Acipenser ruthenus]|uniref:Uncharacterized protein n=1 Tax=Acipenser ruthenus TaxID=7906 RepID=A0A444V7Z1_ACIRT|nr:hypothetical protein EOD39_15593 [Acipenser ruthenus]
MVELKALSSLPSQIIRCQLQSAFEHFQIIQPVLLHPDILDRTDMTERLHYRARERRSESYRPLEGKRPALQVSTRAHLTSRVRYTVVWRNSPCRFCLANQQERQSQRSLWNPQRRPATSHSQDASLRSPDCTTHPARHSAVPLPASPQLQVSSKSTPQAGQTAGYPRTAVKQTRVITATPLYGGLPLAV